MRLVTKCWLAVLAGLAAAVPAGAALAAQTDRTVGGGLHFAWFAARAAGIVAYLLATASVLFGLVASIRLGDRKLGKGNVVDMHRSLSLLTSSRLVGTFFSWPSTSMQASAPVTCWSPSGPGTALPGPALASSLPTWPSLSM